MTNWKQTVEIAGAVVLVAGVVLGLYGMVLSAYAPLNAAIWGLAFNTFWGGIAAIVIGAVAMLYGAYYMKAPIEAKVQREIPA